MKQMINCPFVMRYSLLKIKLKKEMNKPNIFYRIKVTTCTYEHHCELSDTFYNVAIKSNRGRVKVNLEGMNALLLILKDMPQATPFTLRPLMLRYIHHEQPLSSQFIANFRRRVALYHARHPNFEPIPMEHAQQLLSSREISHKELEVLQNPITRLNFNNIYTKVNSGDCTLWESIEYLKECKRTIHGFDFRYRIDANKCPDGLMFMTPRNRYNLIRLEI